MEDDVRRLRDLSVGRRQSAAFAVLGVLIVLLMVGALVGAEAQASTKRALIADQKATAAVLQLKFLAADVNGWQTAYAFEATGASRGRVDDGAGARKEFLASAAAYRSQLAAVKGVPQLDVYTRDVDKIAAGFRRFMDLDVRVVSLLQAGGQDSRDQVAGIVLGAELKNLAAMTEASQRIEQGVERHVAQRASDANRESQLVRIALIMTTLVSLLLAGLLAYFITRSMTRPLRRTVSLLREVAGGDLRGRVAEPGGDELGQMGTALNETLVQMSQTVDGIAEGSATLSAASEELSAVSQQMSAAAEETAAGAGSVSVAAEQVSNNVQSVSAGTEELGTTVSEIARNTSEAAQVAGQAVRVAQQANATVLRLGSSSAEIGEVVKVITSIAEQTNMLALNATIEAARAGDVGKGFAVVAGEVKDLARKTATSSEEIGRKIATIQQDTSAAVEAISEITEIVQRVNDIQTVIAAAVEEQAVTTNEIGRSVTEAAGGASDIARSITGVAETARGTTQGATETHRAAEELARLATDLLGLVRRFTVEGRAPALGAPPR
jgi:methyl-accepting chemotaxis protein